MTSEAKQYAQRNRQGSDWFYHDKPAAGAVPENPAELPSEREEIVDSAVAEEVGPEKVDESAGVNTQTQMIKPKCDSNQWFKHDQAESQPKSPRTPREGELYCKRDKTGSTASWFKHEHEEDGQTDQQRPTTAGSANAARMRSESDHWFNHEGASSVSSSKRFSARPDSSDMQGIFNHGK